MANTTISPNMNMPVPVVGVDPGPDWATDVDACLSIIDEHNHTSGQGVPITPEAININDDLAMNGNNLITTRSVRFSPQLSPLNLPADLGCLYESGVDLYYNDGSGNQVRLTQSGSPAGATGTITGLPSGTASASFAGTTFTFQSATNTPASISGGPLRIAQAVASGFGVTISASGSEVADYALTLPVALPSSQSYVTSDASGNLSFLFNGANVRASEGAGTTTLTSADNFWQIFNLTGSRTVLLPSAGIFKGQRFVMENVGNSPLTVQSSGANTLGLVSSLFSKMELVALVDSPSTAANWTVNLFYSDFLYSHGTTYNGGNAPTITISGLVSVDNSQFYPKQLPSGVWILSGSLSVTLSSAIRTSITVTIADMVASGTQAASGYQLDTSAFSANSYINNSDNKFNIFHQSATTTQYALNFSNIKLAAKPNWAY